MRNSSRVARLALFSIFASLFVSAQITVPSVAQAAPLGSAVFRGDAMLIGSNMPAPGLNDFTYELYFKMNSLPSLAGVNTVGGGIWLFTTRPNRYSPGGITLFINTNGSLQLDANDSAAKNITSITSSSGTVAINNWYHLAITRSNNTFSVWVNGTQVSTGSAISGASGSTGNYNSTGLGLGEYLPGSITNFRFTNAEAKYTATFTPPTTQLTANGTSQVLIPLETDYTTVSSYTASPALVQPSGVAAGANPTAYFGGTGYQDASGNLNAGSFLTNNGITYSALNPFAKVTPTFSWSNVAKNSGDPSFTLTAPTPSTPGTFTYTSGTTSVISLSDTTATVVAPGSSVITANFTPSDSSNYNSATATMTVTVSGANQATFTLIAASGTFGSTTTLGTTGGSGTGAVTYTVVSGNCSVTSDVLSSTSAGNCVLTATKAADATYNAITSAQLTVVIAPAITITTPASGLAGSYGSMYSLSISSGGGGGNNVYAIASGILQAGLTLNSSTGVISGTPNAIGDSTLTISVMDSNNASATTSSFTVGIAKASQSISFAAISDKALSSATLSISASGGASGNSVTFTSATTTKCTVAASTVTFVSAGLCTINANQLGSTNYNVASQVQQSFTILKSTSRTIIFPITSYSLNYGDTQTIAATVSARANIPTITFNTNADTNTNPRLTTGINGNQGVNGNFFGYSVNEGSFTEGQIVTMSDLRAGSTVTYSGKLHFVWGGGFGWAFYLTDILSVTGSSVNSTSTNWLLTGEGAITYSAGASTACSVDRWTGLVTITSGTGTCGISSTVVEDSEYQAMTTTTPVTITVNKLAQSAVTLSLSASSKSAPYSQALTMTSGGGTGTGAKTYAILAGGTASGCALANSSASNTLTATSAGTCLIQATKAADSNYSVAVSTPQTFTFSTSDQAIALSVTSTSGTYGTDLNLTSSGGSGTGTVTFATSTAGCSLPTATTLRATGAITCQVTATKAADADYNAVSSTLTNVVFAAKNLTISGLTGVNKVFDAGISSVIATGTPTLVGVVGADEVTLLGTPIFTFADSAVADNKVVSATGYGLTGAKAANYTLTQPSVTANITKKSATLTATSSTVVVGNSYTPAFTYSGLAGSDSITAITYNYSATGTGTAPTTVGTSTITPSAAVFGVGSVNNYNLSYVNGTLDIVNMYQVSFKSNFTSSDTTTATVNYVPGDTPITPQTPTRNNFTFLGWYTSAIGGTKATGAITPTADTVYWAQWIQNSLNGMGAANSIGTFTTDVNYADTFTRSGAYGTVTVAIPAGALPNATSVSIYQVTDPTRANSLLAGSNYVLSLVVAWLTPAATVPSTVAGKPVTMTITNATIKQGAKIYAIVNDVVTLLGTAAQDGSAQVLITDDPEVVVVFTKPDAPTGVSATTGANASSVVTWSAPASNGGSVITGYKVTANSGQECTSVTTTCSFTGLTNGTFYTFTVNAINAIGISDTSTASVAITPSAPAPAPAPISVQMSAPLPAPVSIPVVPVVAVVPTITSLKFAENVTKDGGKLIWVGTNIESVLFTGDLTTYPAPYNYGAFTLTWSGELVNIVRGKSYTAKLEARSATGGSVAQTITYSIPLTAEDLAAAKAIVDAKAAEEAAALKAAQDKEDAIAKAKAQELAEKLAAEEKAIAEAKAATDKAAADAAIAAALKAAKELAEAEARVAAELKAIQDKAAEDARIAEELRIATELAEANLKIAAEKKALEDAAAAAALAAKKIVPKITLYSISSKLTLSAYDKAYLNKYISTLKSKAIVTCIGYYYQKNTTLTKAKALAKLQADAICKMIKKAKPSVITKIVLYSSTKAPKAAQGAKWVAISYRVDSFKTK